MTHNTILVDFPPPQCWEFKDALEASSEEKWEVLEFVSNRNHGGLQNLIRYFKYFWLPFRIFLKRKQYKTVLAWQQFFGLILALYLRLFRVKTGPDVSVMTFIYKPKASWIGKLYFSFVRYAINCKYIKNVFVYSENEKTYYSDLFGAPKMLFSALKLGVEDEKERMQAFLQDGGYYVSAGRSNRDYAFLSDAWKNQDRQLKILCDTLEMDDTYKILCLKDCHNEDYLKELAGCHGVIIPLQDENISSGQLVLLHAMMLGKPVIITRNNALQEYVQDGKTGIVIEKTEQALADAVKTLENADLYRAISQNAREHFVKNYTYEQLGKNVGSNLTAQQGEQNV